MKKSKRLTMVLDLMEKKEQRAAQALSHRLEEKKTVMQQLQTLEEFRGNYSSDFGGVGGKSRSPGRLQEFQIFMSNISSAINDQKQALEQLEPQLQNSRKKWEGARSGMQGIQKIRDQTVEIEQDLEDKQEQAAMDDKAGRKKRASQYRD